jgi:hypothetical protein
MAMRAAGIREGQQGVRWGILGQVRRENRIGVQDGNQPSNLHGVGRRRKARGNALCESRGSQFGATNSRSAGEMNLQRCSWVLARMVLDGGKRVRRVASNSWQAPEWGRVVRGMVAPVGIGPSQRAVEDQTNTND